MAFFPMLVSLETKEVLVVGGGQVASRKIKTLLLFKPRITVVAKQSTAFVEKLASSGVITLHKRSFRSNGDIKDKDVVIVAVDDIKLQQSIFELCLKEKIPVNCVDSPKYCTFIFPSVVVRESFVTGISTSGRAPLVSKTVRKFLEKILPKNIEDVIDNVERIRNSSLKKTEKEKVLEETVKKLKWNC